MVENDDVAIENIQYVGCIVLLHCGVFNGNVLEVTHGIKGGVTIKATET